MGSSKESEGSLPANKTQKKRVREDGASMTIELTGDKSSPEQEEVESSQALARREATSKNFSIRELPFLIAEKNHRNGEKDASVGADSGMNRRYGFLKSWRIGDDGAGRYSDAAEKSVPVDELGSLIAQKRNQGGDFNGDRKQQHDQHSSRTDRIEVGRTREKGLAEFATLLEQKFRGSSIDERNGNHGRSVVTQGDRNLHGSKIGRQTEMSMHSPRDSEHVEILTEENEPRSRVGCDGGGFGVVLPQSSLTNVDENVGEVEDESIPGLPSRIIEPGTNPSLEGRKHKDLRRILEVAEERNAVVDKIPDTIGRRVGEKRNVTFDGDDFRKPESKLSSVAEDRNHRITFDERSFPFKILAAMQGRTRGERGEASSQQGNLSQTIHEHEVQRERGTNRSSRSLSCSKEDNKNSEDNDKIIPRHPRWTREESMVLLASKRKLEEEMKSASGPKFRSTVKRWDAISAYCTTLGVDRDGHQCRKRWGNLTSDFKRIRNWQKSVGGGAGNEGGGAESYWTMKGDSRRRNKLPCTFDPQMFAEMEAASDVSIYKKKRGRSSAEDRSIGEPEQLASVLENSGIAMQAAFVRSIEAQIQASNRNSELDRNQWKELSDNLVGVLGVLAESLAKIAQRL